MSKIEKTYNALPKLVHLLKSIFIHVLIHIDVSFKERFYMKYQQDLKFLQNLKLKVANSAALF